MNDAFCPILCWNVRGLNNPARRAAVCELATSAKAGILCLQETKMASIDAAAACEIAGPSRRSRLCLPAVGTRGGMAIFWNLVLVDISIPQVLQFSISAVVTVLHSGFVFVISTVYGPVDDALKPDFLQEMRAISTGPGTPWLIAGDFNLIYEARDKNNLNLCRRLMGQFRVAIDHAEIFELAC
ncbi:hypothetical protein BRADI_3g58115v3 [Brachypodium distachyon]|uniref:Endonuclease/exonuclease/phosphatase domain-containing protein n=1 Tax=Brachypodium distachyon TaxID=15368 RepID=A0A2K2D5M1_BRADI|nr:hypothetical protein BRADI_3g58115v3 [Brachypodium distachyon]